MLTKRERDVLDFIYYYSVDMGYPPSIRDIADGLYLNSHYTVQRHVEHLRDKGYLTFHRRIPRSIILTNKGYAVI